jgi:hypothetical protein
MYRYAPALHLSVSQLTDHFAGFQSELRDRRPFLDADNLHRHAELGQRLPQRLSAQTNIRIASENALVRPEQIEWRQGVWARPRVG